MKIKPIFTFWFLAVLIAATVTALIILAVSLFTAKETPALFSGGEILVVFHPVNAEQTVPELPDEDYSERYQRPSKKPALSNPYSFESIQKDNFPPIFKNSEDVLYAYYGYLKEAANMLGYSGGCGTIGNAGEPYPYAYQLFSSDTRKKISLKQFTDSFKGIGHTTFLQLYPLSDPDRPNSRIKQYLVEIEVITGKPNTREQQDYDEQISYFAYYYGVANVVPEEGSWRIQKISYLPEEFLCAPYHSWFYDSDAVVGIVFGDNLHIIDEVTKTETKNGVISLYGSGKGGRYRFDFVRLTNGHDILTGQYHMTDGEWTQVNLLTDNWKSFNILTQA